MTTYPKLMRSEKHDAVVLFSQPCSGVVVHVGDKSNLGLGTELCLGDMGDFKDHNGKVVLENDVSFVPPTREVAE
jgi:hypothetical protein